GRRVPEVVQAGADHRSVLDRPLGRVLPRHGDRRLGLLRQRPDDDHPVIRSGGGPGWWPWSPPEETRSTHAAPWQPRTRPGPVPAVPTRIRSGPASLRPVSPALRTPPGGPVPPGPLRPPVPPAQPARRILALPARLRPTAAPTATAAAAVPDGRL